MTRRTEFDAQQEQLERLAASARECGFDPHDYDDLAPARPLVWLVILWLLVVAAIAMVLVPTAARGAELRGVAMLGAWHAGSGYTCAAAAATPPPPSLRAALGAPLPPPPTAPTSTTHDYHSATPGLGIGVDLAQHDVMLAAGVWSTSHGRTAPFAIADWRPLRWSGPQAAASLGLFAGASGGYCRGADANTVLPLAGATLRVDLARFALHLLAVPPTSGRSATVALALSLALD